jgi:hypothetical protein
MKRRAFWMNLTAQATRSLLRKLKPDMTGSKKKIRALDRLRTQTILLWPNIDAGADHISKAIRVFRVNNQPDWLRSLTILTPENDRVGAFK